MRRAGSADVPSEADDLQAERFAADLHDGLVQWVVAAKMQAEAVRAHHRADRPITPESLDALVDTLQQAVAEGRELIGSLHVPKLADGYWHSALRSDLERTRFAADTSADLQIDLADTTEPLSAAVATTAYRLIREAVWNAERHAAARKIRVHAERDGDRLRIEVADDGRGFDPGAIPRDRMGVRGMLERAARAGGTADLQTAPDRGTRLRFEFPITHP